ncbi:solute carrier organic anion transporter family member 1A2 isoform X3 [Pelodiscus sinensis]|uniref:solute carrier organic anion transporter family member 1A2 isoform X3 n=1 Tax=Pelodiscus sinensis TaxID=13735 RepID=UPI003F6C6CF3
MKEAKKLAATEKFCGVPKLKVFLLALSFAYLAKTMSGGYMNSMLTQIERRFNISASLVGIINGSFETGNLLVIVFVSYIGAKLHRPRIIALGCTVMSFACLLIALPHFLMERYQYETSLLLEENSSSMCLINQSQSPTHMEKQSAECEQKSGSLMWVLVLVGNIMRGIGESPIVPLGISYVEDFSKAENSPFYIGCLQTATVLGPFLGFMLGSYCAQLYVDLGFADIAEVTITLTDARWVGAWWLGILICGSVNLLAAIPFYFLPKSLPKEGQTNDTQLLSKRNASVLEERGEVQDKHKMNEITKDFIPYLRSLFYNPVYMLFICITVLQFSAFIGMITFMPKYVEQQYGKSASQAIFLIGVYNLPVICIGYFLGGYLMKKFKINTNQAANIAFWISLIEYLIFFAAYFTVCDNSPVAGLTVSYEGSLKPEEKSFGVGIHVLASRIFAGIPSPIYFGALIDTTCLKWGSLSCGGKGACRMYDIVTYRWLYLGLQAILRGVSYIPCVLILLHLKKQLKSSQEKTLKSVPMAMEDIEEQND